MKKSAILSLLIPGLVGALTAVPAFAGEVVLYDNSTSASYTSGSNSISGGVEALDYFQLSSPCVVDGATFVLWVDTGAEPVSVNWAITTGIFGTVEASGTANSLPNAYYGESQFNNFDIYNESISIPALSLAAGRYSFELSDGVSSDGGGVSWDVSSGPALGFYQVDENGEIDPENSETFQLLGQEENPVPEPSSFLLLGSGLAGLAGLIRRKLRG